MMTGSDLYQIVNSFSFFDHNYYFERVYDDEYLTTDSIKDKYHYHPYPVYSLLTKNNNSNNNNNYCKVLNLLKGASKTAEVVVDVKKQQQQNQKYSTNIMVVDDEPDTLFTYKTFLLSEGYVVEDFTDSREALKHFSNGLQLYYRLIAINKAIKVLFVSALDAIEELVSVLPNTNYNNILRKPVEKDYFINKIRAVLLPD